MLSLTSRCALKALIHLAQNGNDHSITGSRIARYTKIPSKYLSTVLGELVRAGILNSTRGKGGGFRLARPPRRINLFDAILPFEPVFAAKPSCPFGNVDCGDANPCLAHHHWKKVIEHQQRLLQCTSLHDVSIPKSKPSKAKSKRRIGS